jgi:hypothetical protein
MQYRSFYPDKNFISSASRLSLRTIDPSFAYPPFMKPPSSKSILSIYSYKYGYIHTDFYFKYYAFSDSKTITLTRELQMIF